MKLQILAGSSSLDLANSVCEYLKLKISPIKIESFADGEKYVRILNKVRGDDVFLIQSISPPANDNLVELLITIDALRRASAGRINVVVPYLGYSRQDRKVASREPITAKLVANLITTAGADRICTIDLHKDQIQGFYDIPFDHLVAYPMFAEYIREKKIENITVVSPDVGAVILARKLAALLDNAPIAIIDKRRTGHNAAAVMNVIGDVKNRNAIIIDDMVDTGGTITAAAYSLKQNGAKDVKIFATHALLSQNASEKLLNSPISEAVFMDTIPISKNKMNKKIKQISMAKLLSKVIMRIHKGQSLGKLFDWEEIVNGN